MTRMLGNRSVCWKTLGIENRPRTSADTLEVMLALLVQVIRLSKNDPGIGRQVVEKMSDVRCLFIVRDFGWFFILAIGRGGRHFHGGHVAQAPLGIDRELANRLDFVTEELQAIRSLGIGRKHVQYAASAGKLARQLDGFHALKAMLDQPGRQLFEASSASQLEQLAALAEAEPGREQVAEELAKW